MGGSGRATDRLQQMTPVSVTLHRAMISSLTSEVSCVSVSTLVLRVLTDYNTHAPCCTRCDRTLPPGVTYEYCTYGRTLLLWTVLSLQRDVLLRTASVNITSRLHRVTCLHKFTQRSCISIRRKSRDGYQRTFMSPLH